MKSTGKLILGGLGVTALGLVIYKLSKGSKPSQQAAMVEFQRILAELRSAGWLGVQTVPADAKPASAQVTAATSAEVLPIIVSDVEGARKAGILLAVLSTSSAVYVVITVRGVKVGTIVKASMPLQGSTAPTTSEARSGTMTFLRPPSGLFKLPSAALKTAALIVSDKIVTLPSRVGTTKALNVIGPGALSALGTLPIPPIGAVAQQRFAGKDPPAGWLGLVLDAGYRALSGQLAWMSHNMKRHAWHRGWTISGSSSVPLMDKRIEKKERDHTGSWGTWVENWVPWPMPLQDNVHLFMVGSSEETKSVQADMWSSTLPSSFHAPYTYMPKDLDDVVPSWFSTADMWPLYQWRVPYGERLNAQIYKRWSIQTLPADHVWENRKTTSAFAKNWSLEYYPWKDALYKHTGGCLIADSYIRKATKWVDGKGDISYWPISTSKEPSNWNSAKVNFKTWQADAKYFEQRLAAYMYNCEWLVTAGEWLRLCQPGKGYKPYWSKEWAAHCTAWGVGCASKSRVKAAGRSEQVWSPTERWPKEDSDPLVQMPVVSDVGAILQTLIKYTPPPGSVVRERDDVTWGCGVSPANDQDLSFCVVPARDIDVNWNASPCIDWPVQCGAFRPTSKYPEWYDREMLDAVGDWTKAKSAEFARRDKAFWDCYKAALNSIASLGTSLGSGASSIMSAALDISKAVAEQLVANGVLPGAFLPAMSIAAGFAGSGGFSFNPARSLDSLMDKAQEFATSKVGQFEEIAQSELLAVKQTIENIQQTGWPYVDAIMGNCATITDSKLKEKLKWESGF